MDDGYDVRAAVISSSLAKLFTAGIDREFSISSLVSRSDSRPPPVADAAAIGSNGNETVLDNARTSLQTRKMLLAFQHAIGAPERAPFPVIVAVHGHVIGLGCDIIGVCDIRYAASNTSFAIKVCVHVFKLLVELRQTMVVGSRHWSRPRYRVFGLSPQDHW